MKFLRLTFWCRSTLRGKSAHLQRLLSLRPPSLTGYSRRHCLDVSFVFSFRTETCRRGLSIYKPRLFILVELGRTSFERIVQLFFSVFNRGLQSHRSLTPVVSFLPLPNLCTCQGLDSFLESIQSASLGPPSPSDQTFTRLRPSDGGNVVENKQTSGWHTN